MERGVGNGERIEASLGSSIEGIEDKNEGQGGQEEGEKYKGGQGGSEGGKMERGRGMERESEKEKRWRGRKR